MKNQLLFWPSQQTFSLEELQDWQPPTAEPLSENQQASLQFCRQWLSGAETFTLYTSGSTGAPKPIQLTRRQMETSARATAAALHLQAGMHALVCLPTRYIAGRMMLVRGLVTGLAMTVVEPTSDPLQGLPSTAHFDFTAMTPMQMQQGIANSESASNAALQILDQMHAILLGGAPVSVRLEQQLQKIRSPIYHTYGMTETVSHIALRRLNGAAASPFFVPLPGVELAVDQRSCLNIRATVTNGECLQTNDIVKLQADSSFRWLGRWDNVLNSGGVKVQVEKVEEAIERALSILGIEPLPRFFVGGLPDERLGTQVTLFIEGQRWDDALAQKLRTQIQSTLERYETPRLIVYCERFTETATGKIDRRQTISFLPQTLHKPLTIS